MSNGDKQAAPAKCRQCSRPIKDVAVCDYCHSLNPQAVALDYFALLGLPRQFKIDPEEIRRKFFALNRHAHPDFHANESAEVQELALRMSSAINDAYRTLYDPYERAAYLLELLGGKSSADDKSVPDGFLGTMMMLQEELADARSSGNKDELARLRGVLQTQHDGLMNRIAGLFAQLEEAVACDAVRSDVLGQLRAMINAVSYAKKLLSQVT